MALKKVDLTHGNITRSIFAYAIPLYIGIALQSMLNMADQIVLGQMAGGVALASVGACATVVGFVVNFFVGLAGGVSTVLSRSIGMEDNESSKKIVSTTFITSVIIGFIAVAIAIPTSAPLLLVTKCPEDCFEGAVTYAKIFSLGIPFITVFNFNSTILRVTGDSKRPTIYLIIAGIVNLILNIILCYIMKNKVAAVAIATDIAQAVGTYLTIRRLVKMDDEYHLEFKNLIFDFTALRKILRYGLPSGLSSSLVNVANFQVQAGVNSYGSSAIAGHSTSMSIESLLHPIVSCFGITSTTMVGQNLGAGNKERVKKTIFLNVFYSMLITGVLCVVVYMFRIPLIRFYVPDNPDVIPYAVARMQCVVLWYALNSYNQSLSGTLNAYGYSFFVMVSQLLSTIAFRTFWMQIVYPHFPTFKIIMMCYTVSWIITGLGQTITFIYVYTRYQRGKLKEL